ncbi:MAG: hypothetical protein COZ75_02690 [Flavobacteriaceae bacterium CG_4_8_14_3_um_filter_34_10]|nr:hypothetical protein [Flavobacteriia bacterium]PIQ17683.1 MAG: hypothetical protein COW66_10590 [Flavobacteriaceae bacterium CG18_big_fil_WC_8_21_14_2_50_34_36]PIV48371.1 MAG: hypothetical protein COS19_14150 [Flavobacteriaceae bacterium CG02_land_8_20_14_3_00_34_13]PIX10220.1 MAG: hypothetical protein COZ75_02690 [Flavobacteriaceae bacterium CG_4_8_14_3_um_filter_34_10]PIZ08057.1 MAG: hypothetical protein COY56_05835 [Flavobacteriaceae bacterium CG_4_10_14_0_8_um_filter_34_31]PJC06869.1 MA
MKTKTTFSLLIAFGLFVYFTNISISQVGIGTINPASGSLLDIDSNDKGILIPRVALSGTNDVATITPAASEGLLVYNTNVADLGINSVSEGFYYWNGTLWVRLQTNDKYWSIDGNSNSTDGVNFLGTTNTSILDFKTNNTNRLRIPGNANQIQAMSNGTNNAPFYSWSSDTNIGMWSPGADQLALSAGGIEFLRLTEGITNELVINEEGVDVNTRMESDTEQNMLFVDAGTNRIGLKTNSPQTTLHIAGNNNTLRIDELNTTNNVLNIVADPVPVYVNNSGDLVLQPSLIQNFMPISVLDFIPAPGITVTSATGSGVFTNLYTTSITLTQESLVQVNYQMSVQITMNDGTSPVVDGASRLYRSWVEVNGAATHIGYDSGTYTNNPTNPGGTYAAGYYYLSGSGYVQLAAGTHTFQLRGLTFAGDGGGFGYQITFGQTTHDRFQVIVHR